jgi:hypothetical protein
LQITDFINSGADAFPSKEPANPYAAPAANTDSHFGAGSNTTDNSNASTDNTQNSAPSGVYTSLADTGASTIRGGNLNVVA